MKLDDFSIQLVKYCTGEDDFQVGFGKDGSYEVRIAR
jgi:hypothetical protein